MGAYVVGLLVGFIVDGATVGRNDVGIIEGPDGLTVGRLDGAIELGLYEGRIIGVVVGFNVGEADGTTEGVQVDAAIGILDGE